MRTRSVAIANADIRTHGSWTSIVSPTWMPSQVKTPSQPAASAARAMSTCSGTGPPVMITPNRTALNRQPMRISFLFVNSSAPKRPSSRPEPERLMPPNGSSAPSASTTFTNTMPASTLSATRSAWSGSVE